MKSATLSCHLRLITLLGILIVTSAKLLRAQSENVLYHFGSGPAGNAPIAGLVMDASGALYGTTIGGGPNSGTVFKLSPPLQAGRPWTETTIYNFTASGDGRSPVNAGSLAFDKSGNLYGTTEYGGAFGYGTVFQLAPPVTGETWTETILYSFGEGPDGQHPFAGITMVAGIIYGTTFSGGASGMGTVFKLASPVQSGGSWKETVLYSFTGGSDGGTPTARPTPSATGELYGTASVGGLGRGVVYALTPPAKGSKAWTETTLYSFGSSSGDGANPNGALILDKNGAIYGTTLYGGLNYGAVFELSPPTWSENLLYTFTNGSDGGYPGGSLVFDASGALYGTTEGSGSDHGSIFKLAPQASGNAWAETTLHTFTGGTDGGAPFDGLMLRNGVLYGTTYEGGPDARCNCGVVFKISR